MIGELVVCTGQFQLWHVARNTICFGNRACLRARFRPTAGVTRQALGIEVHRLWAKVVVRVMARQTADARIVRVVAFAAREPVRLKADVGNTWFGFHSDLRPGAMTLPAEIRSLVRRHCDQPLQFRGYRSVRARLHRRQMLGGPLVTVRALYTRNQVFQRELFSLNRTGCVTAKAAQLFVLSEQSARRILQIRRGGSDIPQSGPKTIQFAKPAHPAFKKVAIFFQNVGLANGEIGPHGPSNGHSNRVRSIRDRVLAFVSLAFYPVRVFAYCRGQRRMIDKDFRFVD